MKVFNLLRILIPKSTRRLIIKNLQFPRVGKVKSYNLFSTKPISRNWGSDRGTPIDRYYIEKFLQKNSEFIKGRVLEVGDNFYTMKYGDKKVTKSEILNADNSKPDANYVGDLTNIPQIPDETFDCIILTQTLQLIADLNSAVNSLHRILKTGGALLVTIPGISKIYIDEKKRWPDYWRFTVNSARWLFIKTFNSHNVDIESKGSVLTSIAFLHGLAAEEFDPADLDYFDEAYQMLITIKAVK